MVSYQIDTILAKILKIIQSSVCASHETKGRACLRYFASFLIIGALLKMRDADGNSYLEQGSCLIIPFEVNLSN